jgi:hypothetical protein
MGTNDIITTENEYGGKVITTVLYCTVLYCIVYDVD